MSGKVFSITDFSKGLDTRRNPLAAPAGTLRILENAVINQGGEIEKRLAFVQVAKLDPAYGYLFGHNVSLNAFAIGTTPPPINTGTCPVPITPHMLAPISGVNSSSLQLLDVEAFNDKFQVSAWSTQTNRSYVWYDGVLLDDPVPASAGGLAQGTYSRTYKTKMYRNGGQLLQFSGVGDPSVTDPASTSNSGAGFINIAINDPDGEGIAGMEVFYGRMAIMSRLLTQIWELDPDPAQDTLQQLLRIGTLAPHSIQQFGTGDVLFLSDSGVRSLKAISINMAASVSDVGSAIDPILSPLMRQNPVQAGNAQAAVQPTYGRYWLAIGPTIYVLSYFPAGEITAWSEFIPGFTVVNFAIVQNMLYCTDTANNIYLYGGVDLLTYDSCLVRVRLPHHAASEPTTNKRVKSVDVVCVNNWSVQMGLIPNNTELFELVANISGSTMGGPSIPVAGYGTHVGIHLECQAPGPATISQVFYNLQEALTK